MSLQPVQPKHTCELAPSTEIDDARLTQPAARAVLGGGGACYGSEMARYRRSKVNHAVLKVGAFDFYGVGLTPNEFQ